MTRVRLALVTAIVLIPACYGIAHAAQVSGSSATDATRLPLGDGKVTTSGPRRGWIDVCRLSTVNQPGAFRDGPWIKGDGTYDRTAKAVVDGRVSWPGKTTFTRRRSSLTISGNGLPRRQTTGTFPIATTDDAYAFDRNPNSIRSQSLSYTLPASPHKAAKAGCLGGGPIGIAKNGVPIFDGLDAGDRDAVAHEIQDSCGGHPQQQGMYHYHAIPSCLTRGQSTHRASGLVGYALDGYPIYGPRGAHGKLLADTDLDACHGRTESVRVHGKRTRVYRYHATLEYPYTLGCFHGTSVIRATGPAA
jgi:hypothetical protein